MSSRNRVFAALFLLVGLTAATAAGATGTKLIKKKFHGAVTINYQRNLTGTDRFYGTVTSPKHRCASGALVNLGYRPASEGGGGTNVPRTTVASTHADANGNWEIDYEVSPNPSSTFASFSASSPKRRLKSAKPNVRLVCKFATSEVQTIPTTPP
jgi:hypothetical protein